MLRALDDSIFKVFLQKNCEELFIEYKEIADRDSVSLEERLDSYFILGCVCVLSKHTSVGLWLNILERMDLKGDEDLEMARSIAVHYLGAQLDRLHLDFMRPLSSGAVYSLQDGFLFSAKSGRYVFAVMFLHLAGWHYAVLGQKDIASELFSMGSRLVETKGLSAVLSGICDGGILALSGFDANLSLEGWSRYLYQEMALSLLRFPLQEYGARNSGIPSVVDGFADTLFGRWSHDSFLDLLERDTSVYNDSEDNKKSINELIYVRCLLGLEFSARDLTPDSFVIAGPSIDQYYGSMPLQAKSKEIFLSCFSEYLDSGLFQVDVVLYPHLFRDYLIQHSQMVNLRGLNPERELFEIIHRLGCGSIYDQAARTFFEPLADAAFSLKEQVSLSKKAEESYRKCLANLDSLLGQGDELLAPEWRLNLACHLLQRKGDEPYATILTDYFLSMQPVDRVIDLSWVFSPYDLLCAPNDIRTILSVVSVRSVAVERYIEVPEYGKKLEKFLFSFDERIGGKRLGRCLLERVTLHLDLLESIGWKGDTDLKEEQGSYIFESTEGSQIVFYFFSQEGEWREAKQGKIWELVSSPGTEVVSPVFALNDYLKQKSDASDSHLYIVLVLFPNVAVSQSYVHRLKKMGIFVIPLKQLLEIVSSAVSTNKLSLPGLLSSCIPDVTLLRSVDVDGQSEDEWDFYKLMRFSLSHPLLRQHLKSDFSEVASLYDQVSGFGPVVLLLGFIREFLTAFPLLEGKLMFTYRCALPGQPLLLISEIHSQWDGLPRIVDFRYEESKRIGKEYSGPMRCSLSGTLMTLEVVLSKFYHKLLIIGPSNYLSSVFEREGKVIAGGEARIVEGIFLNCISRYSRFFEKVDGTQQALVSSFQIRRFAEQTARTAIMARNMSHNLGSHVMAYLKQHLASVSEMMRNSIFDQLFQNELEFKDLLDDPQGWRNRLKTNRSIDSIESVTLPFLVGLGRFISYLQERQDFIAGIATDFNPTCVSLNFKDFIYDELNPDKRYLRHIDRKGERPDNILLGNIARSEGLMRETRPTAGVNSRTCHDIILSFRDFDGNPVERVVNNLGYWVFDPVAHYQEMLVKAKHDLDEMRSYSFSIPGGITGRHAVFSIIENIIRNASKHGNWQEKGDLKITIDIHRASDYLEHLSDLDDNLPGELSLRQVIERYYVGAIDGASLYYITLTDNLDTSYKKLLQIRESLVEDYINEDGRMVETSKGIKEMRICASWLRGFRQIGEEYSPVKVGDHDADWMNENEVWDNPAPSLYARISRDKDSPADSDKGHLQFIFAVRIPIHVLIVSDRFNDDSYKELNEVFLKPNLWLGVTPAEFQEGWAGRNYDFLVLDGDGDDLFRQIRALSSSRLFQASQITGFYNRVMRQDPSELERVLLELWEMLSKYTNEKITISDVKAGNGSFVSREMEQYVSFGSKEEIGDYSYIKHYESQDEFFGVQDYCSICSFQPQFVEGISGGNSTDRIVRCEPIDKVWFFKNLHVMKERIAIFDERISNLVYGVDSGHVLAATEDLIPCKDYKGMLFANKNVSIFNFVKASEDEFIMYGLYRGEDDLDLYNPENILCFCRKIAIFTKGSYYPDFLEDDPEKIKSYKGFDRLSIHQGLLDKFYEFYGIKDIPREKELLTKSLYETFIEDKQDRNKQAFRIEDTEHDFLPGMTVHSGRSKPSESDMPQRIPFIQYASLEHAVLDCKYTLVDLLDSAFYE